MFNSPSLTIVLLANLLSITTASSPPPLSGPAFLAPADVTSPTSAVFKAWKNFTTTLDAIIQQNLTLEGDVDNLGAYSFSIGAYSLRDDAATQVLQYHHTGQDVSNSTVGVQSVDSDSVYRLGSISKVLTVYLTLLEIGTKYWDAPLSQFIPDLMTTNANNINSVNWSSVTLGAVAGQMGGILRDAPPSDDLWAATLGGQNGPDPVTFGFPPLNSSDPIVNTPCVQYYAENGDEACPAALFIPSVGISPPVFPPWYSPSYSNTGYDLLALAVENITGRAFNEMMQTDLFDRLKLSSTYYYPPTNLTHAVIPGSDPNASFSQSFGVQTPGGGMYSTVNDMAKFGLSILNSTLLSPSTTAEWLKPVTHTGTLFLSVGRPWEILRFQSNPSSRVVDLYTKGGDYTDYSSYLILSPDHSFGITLLGAGLQSDITSAVAVTTDLFVSTMTPALEAQAAVEAASNFAGTYAASTATGLNSSLTLAVNTTYGSGLIVTSWISNGTDFLNEVIPSIIGFDEVSLFPAGLTNLLPNGDSQVAFRTSETSSQLDTSLLGPVQNPANLIWGLHDAVTYGSIGLDVFVATVNKSGFATRISPAALRVDLARVK